MVVKDASLFAGPAQITPLLASLRAPKQQLSARYYVFFSFRLAGQPQD